MTLLLVGGILLGERRKEVNITNVGSTALTDFPAYINLTKDPDMQADYDDLRFISGSCSAGGSTVLDYEIENYTSSNAHVWIRVPTLSTGVNSICVYYNNSGSGNGENVTGVWDSNYVTVQHLEETAGTIIDSTGINNCTNNGMVLDVVGIVDGGVEADTNTDDLNCGSDSSLQPTSAITVEIWAKSDVAASLYDTMGGFASSTAWTDGYGLFYGSATTARFYVGSFNTNFAESPITSTNWNHVVGTYDSTAGGVDEVKIYVNGVLGSTVDDYSSAINYAGGNLTITEIGGYTAASFDGNVDEFRVSNQARSEDWVNQSYQMVANQASFVNLGAEESSSSGAAGELMVAINTTAGANPLFTTSAQPQSWVLNQGENYTFSWLVNATGALGEQYKINVNFSSEYIQVAASETLNATINITAGASNVAPQIISTSIAGAVDLNEGPAFTTVVVNFTVEDGDGAADLDSSTAAVNITRSGEANRLNQSCSLVESSGIQANYTCSVSFAWFDDDGFWNISASIQDNAAEQAVNDTTTLTVNPLTAFTASPSALTFAELAIGSVNQTANNDPIILNNTGNQDIADGSIDINATHLYGETDNSKGLYSGNFSIGTSTGSNVECAASLMNATSGSFAVVSGAILPRGNFTINDGSTGQEQLYACLTVVGTELSQQAYSTAQEGAWTIRIALAVFIAGGVGAGRKKRKKKRLGREEVEDLLDERLEGLATSEQIVLLKSLKRHLDRKMKKLFAVKMSERVSVPIDIFGKDIGAAEALAKYLKENKEMRLSEIAKVLNRDQRTVGVNYRNASKKMKEKIDVKEKGALTIPLRELSDRRLSILESVVYYLREKRGLRNSEIAKLLEKDPRNVYTLYSRAVRKLESEL